MSSARAATGFDGKKGKNTSSGLSGKFVVSRVVVGRRTTTRGVRATDSVVVRDLSVFKLGNEIGRFTGLAASFSVGLVLCPPLRRSGSCGLFLTTKASAELMQTQTVRAHASQQTVRVFKWKEDRFRFRCCMFVNSIPTN